jgi:cation:H+ antiporter
MIDWGSVTLSLLIFAGGVAVLVAGGEALVRGSVALARKFGVAPLIIGLTIVAFGTSAPELALNIIAAANGNVGLSFGNIIGSNIANIGLVLGVAALLRPMAVHDSVVKRELPIMLLVTLLACALGVFGTSGSDLFAWDGFARTDGIILLGMFAFVFIFTLRSALADRASPHKQLRSAATEHAPERTIPMNKALVWFFLGLSLLVVGGWIAEKGASGAARTLGLKDEVIGLTIVAIATSLPELVTSIVAARKGEVDIAVGNVVGSNIFNLLLVMGVTATIAPVPLPTSPPEAAIVSLGMMAFLSLVLIPMSLTSNRNISRSQGCFLLALYAGYLVYQGWVGYSMQ